MVAIEEKLIWSVKLHPCLYNKSDIGFCDRTERDRAWAIVSDECGLQVKQSQCRWKRLRHRFVREHHKPGCHRTWRYYRDMLYLKDHIKLSGWYKINEVQLDMENKLGEENDNSSELDSAQSCNANDNVEEFDVVSKTSRENIKKQSKPNETNCGSQCQMGDLDPFYIYLGSRLNRVDKKTREAIQKEILHLANSLILKAKNTENNTN